MLGIGPQGRPGLFPHPPDKEIVVIGRRTDHGEDIPALGLQHHNRSGLVSHLLKDMLLQRIVDAQKDIPPRAGQLQNGFAQLFALGVDFLADQALLTAKPGFKGQLHSVFADPVAKIEVLIGPEFLFVGLGDIPQDMGHDPALGIAAQGPGLNPQGRPVHEMGLYPGQGLKVEIGNQ